MASPHAAGAVAFLHSVAGPAFDALRTSDPAAAALELKDIMLANVDPLPSLTNRTVSDGRLNLQKAGVAINPATPVELLADTLGSLDFVLLMSVNPGFAGQDFRPHALAKAERLREMIERRKLRVTIEMDGGIGHANIREVTAAGVEVCVAGSAVFGQEDPAAAMRQLRRQAMDEER